MIKEDVVENSQSEFTSTVLIVLKQDVSMNFYVDYRRLNNLLAKEKYPLPWMDD